MADLSGMVPLSGIDGFQYDATRGLLYLVNGTGAIYAWNGQTGTVQPLVTLDSGGGTLVLTPDGKYALVGYNNTIERIDLSTLTDQVLTFGPAATTHLQNLAATSAGIALEDTSDYSNLNWPETFLAEAASFTPMPISNDPAYPTHDPMELLFPSEHGRYVLMEERGISDGKMAIYDSVSNSITAFGYATAQNYGLCDINETAGLVVNFAGTTSLEVFDLHLNRVKDLSYLAGTQYVNNNWIPTALGVHFSYDGQLLFVWNAVASEIQAYRTDTWQLESLIPIPAISPSLTNPGNNPGIGVMEASGDGKFLFLNYGSGVYAIDLSAELHPAIRGDATHTVLQGTAGADVIIGGPENDTIIASGGGDTIDGGGGVNTMSYAGADAGLNIQFGSTTGVGTVNNHGVDTLTNIQNVIGTAFDDTFLVDPLMSHSFDGGGGSNTISLGGDWIFAQDFSNGVNLQAVSSVIDLTGGPSSITVKLNGVLHTVTDTFTNFHTAIGFGGSNLFIGTPGNDVFVGSVGGGGIVSYTNATSAVTVDTHLEGQWGVYAVTQNTGGGGTDALYNIYGLIGSAFDDHLTAYWVDGGPGNDVLDGISAGTAVYASAPTGVTVSLALQGAPQDTIGAGIDTLTNFENLVGSAFADHLTGDANNNVIDGGGGDDVLDGGGGINTASFASATHGVTVSLALQGAPQATGVGNVTLSNFQNLTGSAYDDTLEGDGNNNVLDGGDGVNTVSYAHATAGVTVSLALQGQAQNTGGAGIDTLSNFRNVIGSAFNDTIAGDSNNNVLDGGGGINTVSYAGANGAVTVSLALQGQAQDTGGGGTDTLYNFRNLIGSTAGGDVLAGDSQDNVIDGGGAYPGIPDIVTYAAATGPIVLTATGAASATVTGQGTDTLLNIGKVVGSAFNDTFNAAAGSAFIFDGGGGFNTVSYAGAGSGVTISTNGAYAASVTGGASGDLTNIQKVIGSAYNDTFLADWHYGLNMDGGGGVNTISFANTSNFAYWGYQAAHLVIDLSAGAATATYVASPGGGSNTTTFTLANIQNVVGSSQNDVILGNGGDNVLDGGGGTNTVSYADAASGVVVSLAAQGQAQDTHGAGVDTLSNFQNLTGSAFNDILAGDSNANVLTGGAGADTFVFGPGGGADEVTDFSHAQGDKLDLSAFRASVHSLSDLLARTTQMGANAVIDLGGGASITLDNVQKSALTASDFILAPASATDAHAGGLKINVSYDASVSSAPAGFEQAVQAAVDYLESVIATPITVNIAVGYGEVGGQAMLSTAVGESIRFGNQTVSYAALRAALLANADTPDSVTAAASLPMTSPLGGDSVLISSAEAKALGLAPANGSAIDAAIGLSSGVQFSFDPDNRALPGAYDALGTLEHELTEALGRVSKLGDGGAYAPMDLFRYTSPGVRDLTPAGGSFSLDGQTLLYQFNNPLTGGDAGDWLGGWPYPADAFDQAGTIGTVNVLSSTDLRLMDALGYHPVAGSAATPPATPAPGVSASFGQAPTQSLTIAQGQTVYVTDNQNYVPTTAYTLDGLAGGGSMTNAGAIEIIVPDAATPATAISAQGGQIAFVNAASGAIYVDQAAPGIDPTNQATGFVSRFSGASFDNAGLMQVVSEHGSATGYFGFDVTAPFVNEAAGTIQVWGLESAIAVKFLNGGSFSNAGAITATGRTAIGVQNPSSFTNTGSIIASDTGGGWGATGLDISGPFPGAAPLLLTNSGLIQGDYAIYYDTASVSQAAMNITLNNSGHLVGDVVFGAGASHVNNTGIIDGGLFIGDGASVLDSHAGTINGAVTLGAGATAVLGAESNTVVLGAGTHVVDGGGGTNTVSYAHAASGVTVSLALQGQAQNTIGAGTDTLSNFQNLIGSAYADHLTGDANNNVIDGGGGNDVLDGGGGVNTVSFASAASGVNVNLELQGQAQSTGVGIDTLSNFPNIIGSAFNDTLHGGAGANSIDGGGGLNTAVYDGVYRQYTVGAGGATVSGGPEGGTDTLANIQRLQFVDGYMAFSPTDTAGQVYRLYEGTLGRAPDPAGLAAWTHGLNAGMTLSSVAASFVGSAEFQNTYGALTDTAFVTLLYSNVLHRAPDAGGLAYWAYLLNTGQDTRAQVVIGFTESAEDINDLAAPVQQGLWIQDAAAAQVARLYDTAFSRLPDVTGLAYWTFGLEHGTTLLQVAQGFIASAEFQADYGAPDNTGFVTLLYNNVLHRAPDAGGQAYWVYMLNTGQETRAQVVVGFSESTEHVNDMAPHIDYGIWVA
jgi:hypothetical protein